MYIETSKQGAKYFGNRAYLISPILKKSNPTRCITFWYYMYGSQVNRLNVYFRPPGQSLDERSSQWTKFDNQGKMWRAGHINDDTSYQHEVCFELNTPNHFA